MPEMDGLQLMEEISALHDGTYIIVITCLENFDLAKKVVVTGYQGLSIKSDND